MKLINATIDSFGKWINTSFDFSKTNLSCFYGENESGKSTLQQFILYMLFGLPPKQRKMFIPKKQTSLAGTLTVEDHTIGMIRVQRIDGTCTCFLEDGEERKEDWWKSRLHYVSKEIYTAVNAFSATDLEAIQTMDQASVSDILFSIGLSGSTTIYEVEKKLTDELDALYKRRGKNPKMNQQMEKVAATKETLQHHREKEAAYAPLIEQKETAKKHLSFQQEKLQILKRKLLTLDKTIQALPQMQKYRQNQHQLAHYPASLPFPNEGLSRYQQLKDKIIPKKSKLALLEEKEHEYHLKLSQLHQHLLEDTAITEAKQVLHTQKDYEHRLKVIATLQASLNHEESERNAMLSVLEWEKDETQGAVLPFHLEDTWGQLAQDQETIEKARTALEEEQLILEEKRMDLRQEEKQIRSELLPETDKMKMEEQLSNDQFGRKNQQQKKQYGAWKQKQQTRLRKFISMYMTLAGLSVIIGIFIEQPLLYGLAILFGVGAAVQYFYTNAHHHTIESMMFSSNQQSGTLSQVEKQRLEQQLKKEQALTRQLTEMDDDLRRNNLSQIQTTEQLQVLDKRTAQLQDRIASERFTYAFLQGLDVTHWPALLQRIRQLQKQHQVISGIRHDMATEEAENDTIQYRLHHFPYADSFQKLEQLLDRQTDMQAQKQQYETALNENVHMIQELMVDIEELEKERNILFKAANVEDEEAFYQVANDVTVKSSLLKETIALKEHIYQLFPEEKAQALLDSELETIQLESDKNRAEEEVAAIESDISNTHHLLGEIQAQIAQLEGAEDTSQLSLAYELEKGKLNEQAKEWMIQKLAQSALTKAKQTYQKKHFAKVMTLTGNYFSQLTNSRYDTIIPPGENNLFQVEGVENIRYTVEELSQGTIDQLYVSLRFAIADVMQKQFDLPLLIDDAFVHFDKTRTAAVIRLMEKLSGKRQVIFFTCKGDIATQFHDVYPLADGHKITG